jgi:uncharacterized protein YcaQ
MWCVGTGRRDPRCGAVAHHAVAFDRDEGIQAFEDARDRCSWRLGAHARHGSNAHDFSGRKPALKVERLTAGAARRLALAAQGFTQPRPGRPPDAGHVRRTIERLGLLQIDSVNILVRSHYLPLFSRLGDYQRDLLDRLAYARRGRALFEYWGHEASLLPLAQQPLLRWRMERAAAGIGVWGGLSRLARERPEFVRAALAEVRERGPIGASELTDGGRSKGSWWGWSDGKAVLEYLFWTGQVTTHSRRTFERVYDLPERVFPPDLLALPTPVPEDAQRQLLRIAARALGVATERDLRDYYRLDVADARARLAELVEAGELVPVEVQGWSKPAYVLPGSIVPRRAEGRALLSPFDALVWERARTERLFGFRFRLEIYTPAHKRTHGYYVLPFLQGDRLVARVDLRADRAIRRLCVLASHAEPGIDHATAAAALAAELRLMASWLGLEEVAVADRGDLAPSLRAEAGSVDGIRLTATEVPPTPDGPQVEELAP